MGRKPVGVGTDIQGGDEVTILAIDPGNTQSAFVLFDADTREICDHGKIDNPKMFDLIDRNNAEMPADFCVIEKVEGFGMTVGAEILETVFWSGRFAHHWLLQRDEDSLNRLPRKHVKRYLLGKTNSKGADAKIRQALCYMFGPTEELAFGTRLKRGPLTGIVRDQLAALAVAVAFDGLRKQSRLVLF